MSLKSYRSLINEYSNLISTFFILLIAVIAFVDILREYSQGESRGHLVFEFVVAFFAAFWGFYLLKKWKRTKDALYRAQKVIAQHDEENKKWRTEYNKILKGLTESIIKQFELWHLTQAEKEVALLLLKGLSLKEISDIRNTSEKTTRLQASGIYAKAKLPGRAELAAFFLEDFLSPNSF